MMVERIQKGQRRRRGRESVIEPAGHDANNNKGIPARIGEGP
jgi:hypothetical protein